MYMIYVYVQIYIERETYMYIYIHIPYWLSPTGYSQQAGFIDTTRLIHVVKDEFGMTIKIERLIEERIPKKPPKHIFCSKHRGIGRVI